MGPITKGFFLFIIGVGILIISILPFMLVREGWKSENGLIFMIGMGLAIIEICMLLDWVVFGILP